MHLIDLPNDAQLHLLHRLDARSLAVTEQCCVALRALSRQDSCQAWRALVLERWGPVCLPRTWSASDARHLLPIWDGPDEPPADWRQLLVYLETVVRTWLCVSVKKAVTLLERQGIVRSSGSSECDGNGAWHETLRRLLTWVPLNEKRRIAAFVCADWQPSATLARFLSPIPIVGSSPVVALRALLLRFPFLPIDAGTGADRVIGCFSRAYVVQNVACLDSLGLGSIAIGRHEPTVAMAAGISDDDSDDEEVIGVSAAPDANLLPMPSSGSAPPPSTLIGDAEFKAARDAVYTLVYSVIMLNTDLHNPAISPKIQPDEYVQSVHRCVPLRHAPDEILLQIYESIARHPLQIAPSVHKVATTIRCSEEAEDSESGATYSVYSALPQRAAVAAAAAAANAAASSVRTPPPIVVGGGTPIVPGGSQLSSDGLPAVDWCVAYWNMVDLCRSLRRKAVRALLRLVPARVGRAVPNLPDHLEGVVTFCTVRLAPVVCVVALAWQLQRLLGVRA